VDSVAVVDNSNQTELVQMEEQVTDLVVVVLLVVVADQTGNLVDILVDLVLVVVQVMDLAEVVVPVEVDLMEIILHKQQLVEVSDYQIVF
jgi:kynureninase|tara:strand:+ start:200 stop:469 length:270 start_codon:yes stop_codon:yes gene_type:complete